MEYWSDGKNKRLNSGIQNSESGRITFKKDNDLFRGYYVNAKRPPAREGGLLSCVLFGYSLHKGIIV